MTYTRRKRTQRALRDPLEHFMAAGDWPAAGRSRGALVDPAGFAEAMAEDAERFAAGCRAALAGESPPWWLSLHDGPEVWAWLLAGWEEEARQWWALADTARAGADPLPPFDYAAVRGAEDAARASQR